MSGEGVELVMLGLDLFPGYDTFAASDIPVFGALPILPGDYTADALFLTGGNATTMAGDGRRSPSSNSMPRPSASSAPTTPGANGSEASLTAALDKAGVSYVSIKGGDNETDAGFQGLMREATKDDPDVLVSLYDDAGCIGAIRARVSLGIDTPTISTPICGSAEVIDVVGDDALGLVLRRGRGAPTDRRSAQTLAEIIEPEYGDDASGSLGLGALGIGQVMTLARVANALAAEGAEVTGAAIYERLAHLDRHRQLPERHSHSPAARRRRTRASAASRSRSASTSMAARSMTVPGFEAFSVVDYLP